MAPPANSGHDLAALGDRDHERVGLLGDPLGGPVPRAGLARDDRGVGRELDVRPHDLGRVLGQRDRAVHLRELVEDRRRVLDVELDASRTAAAPGRPRRRSRSARRCGRARSCRCPPAAPCPARPSPVPSGVGVPVESEAPRSTLPLLAPSARMMAETFALCARLAATCGTRPSQPAGRLRRRGRGSGGAAPAGAASEGGRERLAERRGAAGRPGRARAARRPGSGRAARPARGRTGPPPRAGARHGRRSAARR